MGLDLGAMWDQAKKSAEQGMNDLLKQGGNAGLGYLEGQLVSVIQADQAHHEEQSKQATAEMLARPASPNSFGTYFTNLAGQPLVKQYGPYILAGTALIVVLTLYARGK